MGNMISRASTLRIRRLCALIAALLLMLGGLALLSPQRGLADGGGWPTATRTRRPTKTPTLAGTIQLPFLYQITETPANSLLPGAPGVLGQPGQTGPSGAPIIGFQAPTPTPAPRPFSLISCWPFALVGLALLIVGIIYLTNRLQREVHE